jgi:Putative zinc-finger
VTPLSLGGPGPGCSATRVRRLAAGELDGAERVRMEEHLAACARCQATRREVDEEQRVAVAALPFEALAAGVAERLARGDEALAARAAVRRRAPAMRLVPLALAASLAIGVAVPLVSRLSAPQDDGVRAKGAAALTAFVQEGGAPPRVLAPGEAVAAGARLRIALPAGPRRHAAVLLLDADGVATLYAGPARPGPLPDAFEWTGAGEATVVAVLSDEPIAVEAVSARLASGGIPAAAAPGREVVTLKLLRGRGP